MEDKTIKVEGQNRITFDIVIECVKQCIEDDTGEKITKEQAFKETMRAIKTNGVIFSICRMIHKLRADDEKKGRGK